MMTELEPRRQLTLGELTELMREVGVLQYNNPSGRDKTVRFDFGYMVPTEIRSERGDYSHLAIGYRHIDQGETTVAALLERLEKAAYATFEGYKGGTYIAKRSTPMWAANWGEWCRTAIVGVIDAGFEAVLVTEYTS